jgi:hypothetical protein
LVLLGLWDCVKESIVVEVVHGVMRVSFSVRG